MFPCCCVTQYRRKSITRLSRFESSPFDFVYRGNRRCETVSVNGAFSACYDASWDAGVGRGLSRIRRQPT